MPARCHHHADRIAKCPRIDWKAELERLPKVCPATDCNPKHNCYDVSRNYLLVQAAMQIERRKRR